MDYFSHGTTFAVRAQMACWTQQNNHCDITYSSTIKILLLLKQQVIKMYKSESWHRRVSHNDFEPTHFSYFSQRLNFAHTGFIESYLLLLSALQIPPLLCYVAEVHLVHGHLDVADGIVFGEAVKIVHRHHQRLSTELYIRNLSRMTSNRSKKVQERFFFLYKCCTWIYLPIQPFK